MTKPGMVLGAFERNVMDKIDMKRRPSAEYRDELEGVNMEQGFVVLATRNEHRFFRSFHRTEDLAQIAMRKTIDADALSVSAANVVFATNGNLRYWDTIGRNAAR